MFYSGNTLSFLRASHLGSRLLQAQSAQLFLGSSFSHFSGEPTVTMTTTKHKAVAISPHICQSFPDGAKKHFGIPPSSCSSPKKVLHPQQAQMFPTLGRSGSCRRYHPLIQTCWHTRVFSAWHKNSVDSPKSTVIQIFTYILKLSVLGRTLTAFLTFTSANKRILQSVLLKM